MNEQEAIAYWNKLRLLFDDDGRICFLDTFDAGTLENPEHPQGVLLWMLDDDGWTVRDAGEFGRVVGHEACYTLPDSDTIEVMRQRYRDGEWEDEDETE